MSDAFRTGTHPRQQTRKLAIVEDEAVHVSGDWNSATFEGNVKFCINTPCLLIYTYTDIFTNRCCYKVWKLTKCYPLWEIKFCKTYCIIKELTDVKLGVVNLIYGKEEVVFYSTSVLLMYTSYVSLPFASSLRLCTVLFVPDFLIIIKYKRYRLYGYCNYMARISLWACVYVDTCYWCSDTFLKYLKTDTLRNRYFLKVSERDNLAWFIKGIIAYKYYLAMSYFRHMLLGYSDRWYQSSYCARTTYFDDDHTIISPNCKFVYFNLSKWVRLNTSKPRNNCYWSDNFLENHYVFVLRSGITIVCFFLYVPEASAKIKFNKIY